MYNLQKILKLNIRIKIYLLIYLVGAIHLIAPGQTKQETLKNYFFIEPKVRMGPVLDIYPNLPEHSRAVSSEINLAWQTAGKQYWDQPYNFPQIGVLFALTNLGNNDILGQEFSVVPNLVYRFKQFGRFELSGMFGIGFAFFNKPYNRIDNPQNKLIGSFITNKTILAISMDYELSHKFRLSSGFSYLHYSNGHYQLPNIGVNIPAFQFGVKYYTNGYPAYFHTQDSIQTFQKRWLFNFRIGLGIHEFGDPEKPVGGPKYPVYNGSVYISKRLGIVTNFHAGLHINYYTSFYDFISFQELYKEDQHLKSLTAIGFAGIEFFIGKFSFSGQMGVYLYNPLYKDLQEIRNETSGFKNIMKRVLSYKLGTQYYLFNTKYTTRLNPWIGIFLKSNAGQADFTELSIGCAF